MASFESHEIGRWKPYKAAAVGIRLVVLLAPVAVALAASFAVTRLIPAPAPMPERVVWLGSIVVGCSVLAWPARHLLRRLLPLAALLEMSLLFPGEVPTRWKVAREAGSIQHLQLLASGVPDQETGRAATTILALVASLARHDSLTRGHSHRVRVFTDMIAEEMRLPRSDRDRLRWAALIHDVGKLEVPAKLLRKPGKPTSGEWEVLRRHPEAGARLTAPLADWLGPFAAVAVQHHERFDGTGYPAGLRGHQISLGGRIVALADAFEVMTASRPYKRAMSRTVALREVVQCSGTHFDPSVVRAFLAVSMPRLRRAMGPASWVGQLPAVTTAPVGGFSTLTGGGARGTTAAIITGAVAAGSVAGSFGTTPVSPEHEQPKASSQRHNDLLRLQNSQPSTGITGIGTASRPIAASAPTSRVVRGDSVSPRPHANGAGPGAGATVNRPPVKPSTTPAPSAITLPRNLQLPPVVAPSPPAGLMDLLQNLYKPGIPPPSGLPTPIDPTQQLVQDLVPPLPAPAPPSPLQLPL